MRFPALAGTLALAAFAFSMLNDACAADAASPAALPIARTHAAIRIDGLLDDEGWQGAAPIDVWYETNPGDNTPPKVRSVGYLSYDDKFFYAGFEFEDPDPGSIRAPLGDRDNVPSSTDYAGVVLNPRNDRRTATIFVANPRGIQFDSISDDASGNEDASPDFFWDAAGKITPTGWSLEIRIPFSSLRYASADPQSWGIMLYRNYPRDFRYQIFSARLPRGSNCFICNSNSLEGLSGLPGGGHLVLAPYASGRQQAVPTGEPGTPLDNGPLEGDAGLDVKWTPLATAALDATLNPDFSQIESDVAQIGSNERFALFFPEKRPFFLEGSELFSTPIQAVYTRTITSPRWGVRGTGKFGKTGFTGLVAQDRGGGSVILPGPNGSDFADQDFRSVVALGRLRRDLGDSFVSLLATERRVEGGGSNQVLGPDFQWQPSAKDKLTGQFLISWSRTPDRPDLAGEWSGKALRGHAADVWWNRSTRSYDWFAEYKDFGDGFRADNGFVPQVGFRESVFDTGYTVRPEGFVRRLRSYFIFDRATDRDGELLNRSYSVGIGTNGVLDSFARIRWAWERVRAGDGTQTLPRSRLIYSLNSSPSRLVSELSLDGFLGEEIDFENVRTGSGGNVSLGASIRPGDHLELRFNNGRKWLNVNLPAGSKARLFTAKVDRLRATYTFTARCFLRLIGQYVTTTRDPSLYADVVDARSGSFNGSALFAYKLNWQTVLFAGYGDNRALDESADWQRESREFFVKLSYAFQR